MHSVYSIIQILVSVFNFISQNLYRSVKGRNYETNMSEKTGDIKLLVKLLQLKVCNWYKGKQIYGDESPEINLHKS